MDYFNQSSPTGQDTETFVQRQRRLRGQQTSNLAAQPQDNYQSPTAGTATAQPAQQPSQGLTVNADAIRQVRSMLGASQPNLTTPVSGTGKIPEPTPAPAPAPVAQTPTPVAPAPQPTTATPTQTTAQTAIPPDPFATMGGGVWTGSQWVPKDHPLAATATPTAVPTVGATQASPAPSTTVQQIPGSPLTVPSLGTADFATYNPYQFSTPIPELGDVPEAYKGTTFSQFAAPDQAQTQGMTNTLLQAILANPETLGPQVLSAMKERNKEGALLMQKQGMQQAGDINAARGLSGGGLSAMQRAIMGEAQNSVLTGNRDLDIAAAERNREDQLKALSMADAIMSGELGRSTEGYRTRLLGESTQAEDTRTAAQMAIERALNSYQARLAGAGLGLEKEGMQAGEGWKGYESEMAAQQAAIQRTLAQFGMSSTAEEAKRMAESLTLQGELGRGGLALDQQRLSQNASQFDKNYGLNVLQFLEGQRESNNQTGLGYAQLGQSGQNALMNYLLGIS